MTTTQQIGWRLMMATAPLAETVIGIPLAAASFTAGWLLQYAIPRAPTPEGACEDRIELDEATAELLG